MCRQEARGKSERDKQTRRPVYSDADLKTIRRNAEQLLLLHQRFVRILKEKLEPLGFGSALVETPTGRESAPEQFDASADLGQVDEAVNVVAETFTEQVCHAVDCMRRTAPCSLGRASGLRV